MVKVAIFGKDANVIYGLTAVIAPQFHPRQYRELITTKTLQLSDTLNIYSMVISD